MVAIAETIIERRTAAFDPQTFRDRYQDALRELVEAKTKGLERTPREVAERSDIALAGPRIDTIPGAQAVP